MKRTFKKKNLIYFLVIFVLLFMSTGYAALRQTLNIFGDTLIGLPEYSVIIKSIDVTSSSNSAYQNTNPTFTNTEGATYSVLPNVDSTLTYTFRISNVGRTSAVLDYIFTDIDNSSAKIKIGGINTGDVLVAGEQVFVTVEIAYWDDITSVSNLLISSMINFEFIPYTSDYSNECTLAWDGSSTSEPTTRTIYGISYYQISNANELAWFTNTVNSGSNNINAIITNNICLNSKSISQIGTDTYAGIFDGQNRTIEGYYHNQDYDVDNDFTAYVGLFRNNSGHIKNLNLVGNISEIIYYVPGGSHNDEIYDYLGGIVSINSGKISNSSFSGSIFADFYTWTNCFVSRPNQYDYVGAIASVNKGVITGSYNVATLDINATATTKTCMYRKSHTVYVGGVIGQNNGYLSDSYNANTLSCQGSALHKNSKYYGRVGGVVGDFIAGRISNIYNSGSLTHSARESDNGSVEESFSGGAIGSSAGTINNVYYLDTCGLTGTGTSVSVGDLSALNVSLGNYFEIDTRNINGGFPILRWQN